MNAILVTAAGLLGLWPGSDCEYTARREATASMEGVKEVRIRARAGSLTVQGATGLTEVRAHGEACAYKVGLLDEMRLTATRQGDVVTVEAEIPDTDSWMISFGQRRLDFTVEVPADVAVDVEDGSGEAEIRNVGSLRVRDGSGELRIRGVHGDARIVDGSGAIEVEDVSGTVTIEDGSGGILVRNVGALVVDEDGSGAIEVERVKGDVLVRRDGSGSISVREVGGDFTVERDGSGGITHTAVKGRVRVPRDRD